MTINTSQLSARMRMRMVIQEAKRKLKLQVFGPRVPRWQPGLTFGVTHWAKYAGRRAIPDIGPTVVIIVHRISRRSRRLMVPKRPTRVCCSAGFTDRAG